MRYSIFDSPQRAEIRRNDFRLKSPDYDRPPDLKQVWD